jgi:hypothetical protein
MARTPKDQKRAAKDKRKRRHATSLNVRLSSSPFGEKPEGKDAKWVQITSLDLMPTPYTDVRLQFEMRSGTWTCTGFYLTGTELSPQEIAERLPFAQLAQHGAEGLAMLTDTQPPRVTEPRRRGRLGNSDEFLGQIAELYRYALSQPKHSRAPVAFIRSRKELWRQGHQPAEDTVRAWVRQARRRGLLGASMPGKPGERSPEAE